MLMMNLFGLRAVADYFTSQLYQLYVAIAQ